MSNQLEGLMREDILPLALRVLRENCTMPMLVHTDFQPEAQRQNAKISVPGPQNLGEADDAGVDIAAYGSTQSSALNDGKVEIVLDQWKYKQFDMNDKEMREAVTAAILPSAAEDAVKRLANAAGMALFNLYKDIPYYYGTAGTTPSAADDITGTRKILNKNLAPNDLNRRLVLDPDAEDKFLAAFHDASKSGSTEALRLGSLGRKFGFDTFMDQLAPSHTSSVLTTPTVSGAVLAGATTMNLGVDGTESVNQGDIFEVDGVTGTFVFTETKAAVAGTITGAGFYPAAPTGGFGDGAAITVVGNHAINLAFHRDAFAFVSRPLELDVSSESSTVAVEVDPLTGISLRLETWRAPGAAKRYWRFDILFGVKTLTPELAVRLIG
jgi:hypothetical protein